MKIVKLSVMLLAQAAACHNFGAFTCALAVNLLDRFMASQRPSVRISSTSCHLPS